MADGPSSNDSGGIWRGLKAMIFRGEREPTLRDQIEEAIEEHEEDPTPAAEDDLGPMELQMVRRLLQFGDRTVDDVAVPRSDIVAIEESASFAELVARFAGARHSRLPVYKGSLDRVTGMVHIRDAFAALADDGPDPQGIADLIRQPLYVPQSMGVLDLLALMRSERIHLAIVLDEYSGTEGLVTIEDLVEEIVGDIEDEYDAAPEQLLVPLDGGLWDADARAELDDVAEAIDPRLAEVDGDVDTLGGLAFVLAGHVPQPGEIVAHPSGWRVEVIEGDERRATRLRLHPPPARVEPEE